MFPPPIVGVIVFVIAVRLSRLCVIVMSFLSLLKTSHHESAPTSGMPVLLSSIELIVSCDPLVVSSRGFFEDNSFGAGGVFLLVESSRMVLEAAVATLFPSLSASNSIELKRAVKRASSSLVVSRRMALEAAVSALTISLSGSSSNTSQVAEVVASSAISALAKVRDDGKASVRPSAEAVAAEVVAVTAEVVAVVADLDMMTG